MQIDLQIMGYSYFSKIIGIKTISLFFTLNITLFQVLKSKNRIECEGFLRPMLLIDQ
jgi:hypothetical protein